MLVVVESDVPVIMHLYQPFGMATIDAVLVDGVTVPASKLKYAWA